jgi:hypothetical protein
MFGEKGGRAGNECKYNSYRLMMIRVKGPTGFEKNKKDSFTHLSDKGAILIGGWR